MFILKKEHQPGVYVPLRALFLVSYFFLKYSYFLNETKIKNVYVSLLQKKTCYTI